MLFEITTVILAFFIAFYAIYSARKCIQMFFAGFDQKPPEEKPIFKHKKPKKEPEKTKYDILLENIEAYDGTEKGQQQLDG